MEDIDFSDPHWLLNYFHFIGLVSFVLNSIGIYFLMFMSNQLGNFKHYLLLFQLSCVLTDIDFTILVQPIPLFPLFAGHVYGLLFTWFNMQASTAAVTVAFVTVIQLESLIVCFVKKHQGVAILLNKHILSKCVINALYVFCLIFPFFVCAGANRISLSREDALIYIKEVYPQGYLQFSNLPNFVVYMKSQNTIIFLGSLFFAASFGFTCLCLSIYDIIRMMAHLKLRISKVTYEKHSEALRSVIIQFITAVLCMVSIAFVGAIQIESLIVCFVKKHQGVAILLNKHILSKSIVNALYIFCLIFPFFVCATVNSLSLSRENALIYIKEVYPQGYLQFSKLPNFVVYVKSQNTIIFIVSLFFAASFGFTCLCLSIYDIIRMMADLKLRISKLTYEKHNEALRSVIIQFIAAVLCMAGPMLLLPVLVFEIPYMNFISELIFAWFSSHSSINMVALFIFFPPYRRIIVKAFKKTKVNITFPVSSFGH